MLFNTPVSLSESVVLIAVLIKLLSAVKKLLSIHRNVMRWKFSGTEPILSSGLLVSHNICPRADWKYLMPIEMSLNQLCFLFHFFSPSSFTN